MSRQLHLIKSGSGLTSKTACGRNVTRTPMSTTWTEFKTTAPEQQCARCRDSKLFAFLTSKS